MTLQVGQTLWYTQDDPRYAGSCREVVVTKIGRRWATLGNGDRIDIETMWLDGRGYASPGRCWPSREVYEAEQRRQAVWSAFRCALHHQWQAPENVTVEQIDQVSKLLGIGTA